MFPEILEYAEGLRQGRFPSNLCEQVDLASAKLGFYPALTCEDDFLHSPLLTESSMSEDANDVLGKQSLNSERKLYFSERGTFLSFHTHGQV